MSASSVSLQYEKECPCEDSNLGSGIRNPVLYPPELQGRLDLGAAGPRTLPSQSLKVVNDVEIGGPPPQIV